MQPSHQLPKIRFWLLTAALCTCSLLAGHPAYADDPAPAGSPAARQKQNSEALLLKAEQQIFAGHFIWPQDDNALQTWQLFMKNASPADPGTRQALAAFAEHMHNRAIEEQTQGRPEISKALMSFDAMAQSMLDAAALQQTDTSHEVAAAPSETTAPDTAHTDAVSTAVASTIPAAASASRSEVRPPDAEAAPPTAPPAAATVAEPAVRSPPVVATGNAALALAAPPPARPPATHQPDTQQQAMAATYVARGNEKLAIKDISAARKIYEYAASLGSAAAAMALAKTYDAAYLAQIGAVGVRPDQALALTWYRKAAVLGDPNARLRLQALGATDAN